ncbi:MAG TPA: anthranilate synthase component I family protein [Steroidobacteraceae bacterium]|nr:anthranilate synthase component I family protein [Steroidobacteraceae bacterium]
MKAPFDISGDLNTPVSAYLKLAPFRPRFLLESVEGGERLGRYSFIGFGDALDLRIDGQGLRLDGRRLPAPANGPELLAVLRAALTVAPKPRPEAAGVPLAGGLVGYAGYDVVRMFERLPARRAPAATPLLHYVAPASLLVFDHVTRGIALLHGGPEAERAALKREVTRALQGGVRPCAGSSRFERPRPGLDRGSFLDAVRRAKEHIAAGDIYQLVLSICFEGRHALDPFQVYRALRAVNPSPYLYYCALDEVTVIGSSPEALVRLNAGVAELRPIAGTRPRADTAERDLALEAELRADEKENAEHVMLVDLARNDLGRVAESGTVRVAPYRSIERYSHVMHLVSGVAGRLAPGRDAFDLFAAAFPAGTLVGAPKVRAMQILDELEPAGRGLYGGTVGYFGLRGDMDQAITIRTLVFQGDRYSYQAGAGIVSDSDPAAEHAEILSKGAAMLRALELAESGL